MKGVGTRLFAAALCLALALMLCACNNGVYSNDDNKKSVDPNYTPTSREPLALTASAFTLTKGTTMLAV